MYLCICKGISEKDIRQALQQGCCNLQKLRCQTGLGSDCGRCRKSVREYIKLNNPQE